MAFNPNFKTISPPIPLPEMPQEVINDLSTDQHYAYRICKMIATGEVDEDLLNMKVGIVCHSRWLTTACRFCRLYISKHKFTGEVLKKLNSIVTVCVWDYFPMWFFIKSQPRFTSGPHHILKEVGIIREMKGKDEKCKLVRSICEKFVGKGAWQAHSEPLLLSLLSSDDIEDRRFAISKILDI